jgi:hypothetical protein
MRKRSASPIRPFDVVPSDVVHFAKRLSALLAPDAVRPDHSGPAFLPDGPAPQVTTRAGPWAPRPDIPPIARGDRTTVTLGAYPTGPTWATGGRSATY